MTLEKSFPAMGTVHTITIFDAEGPGAAGDARAYLMALNRAWTCFHEDSLISTINRAEGGASVPVDRDTFEVLRLSKRYSDLTEGAFDVTVGPLADLWREAIREQRLPTDEAGYLKKVDGTPRTQLPGIFVAGDCADPVYRQAISAAGSGCQAAIEAERFLLNR